MKMSDNAAKMIAVGGILVLAKYCDIMAPDKVYYMMWGAMALGLMIMPSKGNKKDGEK